MASEKLDAAASGHPIAPGNDEGRPQTRVQRLQNEQTIGLTGDAPQSPSDAVMIRRGQAGRSSSGSPTPAEPIEPRPLQHISASRDDSRNEHRDDSPSSIHRRTISAPEPASNDDAATSQSASAHGAPNNAGASSGMMPIPAGSPTAYRYYLDPALVNSAVPRLYPTIDELMSEVDISLPKACKYMDGCELSRQPGTNWRKAMSHIFGRNKNCTRSIPENVWILMCRKHYQRARYRNNLEYNKRLCKLVETQILRVEAWSNENRRNGTPQNGIVQDWAVVPRRREQLRLDEAKSKKRSLSDEDDDDNDDDAPMPANCAQVPRWLLDECRPGHSASEIQRIVARIGEELRRGNLTQMPDIEILPNITGENAKPKGKTRAKARTPATTPHRRTQSMGNATQAPADPSLNSARRGSQPNASYFGSGYRRDEDGRPTSKRQRFDELDEEEEYDVAAARFPPRSMGRTIPDMRPLTSLPPGGNRFHDERAMPYDYTGGPGSGPLPAPRSYYPEGARPIGAGAGYDDYRARAPHQRAFSDASAANFTGWNTTMPFAAPSGSTGYDSVPTNGYGAAAPSYYPPAGYPSYNRSEYVPARPQDGYAPANGYYQQSYHQHASYYQPSAGGPPPPGAAKHMRHQSTPVRPAHQAMGLMGPPPPPAQDPFAGGYGAGAAVRQPYNGLPAAPTPAAPARDNMGGGEPVPEGAGSSVNTNMDGAGEGYDGYIPARR
ncbi:hypothetical protein VTK26DRAFT_6806 [Humicola hyalothermophila]